ncbi:MAG: DivIVA domain-containing protein [Clostridiales bacterium]|nr:DivIVA domain-containing protein [Clostridiales bacterium]
MAITVTMIEEKEFKTKVRGYDPVEVDEFLDAICDEMVDMQNTIQTLREQLKQKSEQSASYAPLPVPPVAPAPLPPISPMTGIKEEDDDSIPVDIETAQKLLADTQQACDKALAEAKKRAEAILKEAEDLVPDPELMDLEAERDKVREEIEKLKSDAMSFRKRFQSMLRDQNDILETDLF